MTAHGGAEAEVGVFLFHLLCGLPGGGPGFAQKGFFNTGVLCKKFFNPAIPGSALRGDALGLLPRPPVISLYDGWIFLHFG